MNELTHRGEMDLPHSIHTKQHVHNCDVNKCKRDSSLMPI